MQECTKPAYKLYIRHTRFYEGQKHLHHDCMKVWNFAPGFYEGLKKCIRVFVGPKNCIRIVWGSEQFASGFYEGLSNFHQDFMKVWTLSSRISWRSEQFPSGFHDGLENASWFYDGLKKNASGLYEGLEQKWMREDRQWMLRREKTTKNKKKLKKKQNKNKEN